MKTLYRTRWLWVLGSLSLMACSSPRSYQDRDYSDRESSVSKEARKLQEKDYGGDQNLADAKNAEERDLRRRWMRLEARFENVEPELGRIDEFLEESIERDLDRTNERLGELADAAMNSETWRRLRRDLELDLSRLEGDILEAEQRIATVKRY